MPRSKKTTSVPAGPSCQLVINFGDDATQWFQGLSAAVAARPAEIEVQFVGGCTAPPCEMIALRNALLRIPQSIRLVTTALVSLPPMTCAAWLAGDERRIARDAVVWIPDLPEDILRYGLRRQGKSGTDAAQQNLKGQGQDPAFEEEEPGDDEDNETQERPERPRGIMVRRRCERDLRALADVLNEWFPSWEFKGGCLNMDDLVVWDVVKPEWCFGGRGVRSRDMASAQTTSKRPRAKRPMATGDACIPSRGNHATETAEPHDKAGHPHKESLLENPGAASEPESASKPSDL